jgi:DNA-binding transcriptional regulator YiaG
MTPARIRKLRESLGLTQEEFAKRIGAARETIARWELGTAKPKGLYLQALEKLKARAKAK